MIASAPDLLRLIAIPAIAWAAWSDFHTRRVDPRVWVVLLIVGATASMWQVFQITPIRTAEEAETVTRLLIVPPTIGAIGGVLFISGSLGGADAKAIFAIALMFPSTVYYTVPTTSVVMPMYYGPVEITAVAILVNGLIFAMFYPISMWYRNIKQGERSSKMVTSESKTIKELMSTAGIIRVQSDDKKAETLDLDALRMYLRWRGIEIGDVVGKSEELRNPNSVEATYEIGDGAIQSEIDSTHFAATSRFDIKTGELSEESPDIDPNDEWGAMYFLNSIDSEAYGTTENQLRAGLNHISRNQTARVMPAFPLIVPMFFGLLTGLTVGDAAGVWVALIVA